MADEYLFIKNGTTDSTDLMLLLSYQTEKERQSAAVKAAAFIRDRIESRKKDTACLADLLGSSDTNSPTAAFFREHGPQAAAEADKEVGDTLFEPNGGWKGIAVADVPDSDLCLMHAANKGALLCGLTLHLIARMAADPAVSGASINKAMAVQVKLLPVSLRTLKIYWGRWSAIAHLWAGLLEAAQLTDCAIQPLDELLNLYDIIAQRPATVVGHACWFRDFATTYKPPQYSGTILPRSAALKLVGDAEPLAPTLRPLSPRELAAAAS